ncbi:MAG: protein kinase domain-containing protein [Anaerolineae bacterium]
MTAPTNQQDLLNDRYLLLEVIGEGGMAMVWRAHDKLLDRTVAVKVLRPQYAADPEFLDRFRSEARSAAALNHPGVVAVYDVGEDGDQHYLVMEYVPGSDLKAVIREDAPLSTERAIAIGAALARAVGEAHDVGMVHRDIKPQNVLISPDGTMKVADFGIARAVAATGTTAPGVVMGTVHYISPEQASGQPAQPASDVYSLGVVLYEMLTGRLPHDADSSVGVAMKIMNEAPEPIEAVNPAVPAVLAGIVTRAMARTPDQRYADANALAEALEGFARWSGQHTGGLGAVVEPGLAGAGAAGGAGGVRPGGPSAGGSGAAIPPPRQLRIEAQDEPLLDLTGLLLAMAAVLAVAGLFPLWSAVRDRLRESPAPVSFIGGETLLVSTEGTMAPAPTAVPTVVYVLVPSVTGESDVDAEADLRAAGLASTTSLEPSDAAPPGQVLRQSPSPGESVPSETVVELVVSGEPSIAVPAVAGDWATASQTLEQYGFVPVQRFQWGGANSATAGQVISLNPPSGNHWRRGAPVYVTVDSGSWLPLGVDFDDNIHLSGVDLPRASFQPGEQLVFVARWEATDTSDFADEGAGPAEARGDYLVRAVLVGPDGHAVATDEHVPVAGSRPTSSWQPGEVIADDVYTLAIDPAATPGQYTLWLDLRPPDSKGASLGIVHSASRVAFGDRVRVLSDITVGGTGADQP